MSSQPVEDLLEKIWFAREEGRRVSEAAPGGKLSPAAIEESVRQGLAVWEADGLSFTSGGERLARSVVRRHRLAEELLSGVLDLKGRDMYSLACGVEHVLSETVTERICTLLGHPVVCPHGRPIPPGECCARRDNLVEPLVERLTALGPGGQGRIVFMAPGRKLDRLMALGLVPGASVKLVQKSPACVVQVGETMVAVDESILAQIFVRPSLAH